MRVYEEKKKRQRERDKDHRGPKENMSNRE